MNNNCLRIIAIACLSFLAGISYIGGASAHQHSDGDAHKNTQATVKELNDNIFMIQVGGGNIAVSIGDEGVFMIDNGLSENSEDVMKAMTSLSDDPVKLLVNTHWHFDHAGNNDHFGSKGTVIIAHDNVRERLKDGGTIGAFNKIVEPASSHALPVLTYDTDVTIHLNGQKIDIISVDPAHTDGDSIIFWENENVLHTGDIFFNGFFPFIDKSSGGSLRGMLKASERILGMINEDTIIIPGHGPVAAQEDLESYNKMLKDLVDRLATARAQGMSKEDWVSSNSLKDLDVEWGDGFLDLATFTPLIWDAY